jgi:hypothetical protein
MNSDPNDRRYVIKKQRATTSLRESAMPAPRADTLAQM